MAIPKNLYRYLSIDTDEKKKRVEEVLLSDKLYFTSPARFNDPFDCKYMMSFRDATPEDIEKYLDGYEKQHGMKISTEERTTALKNFKFDPERFAREFMELTSNQDDVDSYGLLCLSSKNDDLLMWSHYANGHRGICLEFSGDLLDGRKSMGQAYECQEVEYSAEFLRFREINEALSSNHHNRVFRMFFLRKAEQWSYENEWRIIVPDGAGSKIEISDRRLISGVILGCEITPADKKFIEDFVSRRDSPIKLYEAKKGRDDFKVTIVEATP